MSLVNYNQIHANTEISIHHTINQFQANWEISIHHIINQIHANLEIPIHHIINSNFLESQNDMIKCWNLIITVNLCNCYATVAALASAGTDFKLLWEVTSCVLRVMGACLPKKMSRIVTGLKWHGSFWQVQGKKLEKTIKKNSIFSSFHISFLGESLSRAPLPGMALLPGLLP